MRLATVADRLSVRLLDAPDHVDGGRDAQLTWLNGGRDALRGGGRLRSVTETHGRDPTRVRLVNGGRATEADARVTGKLVGLGPGIGHRLIADRKSVAQGVSAGL